jgi:hypothetical protein
MLTALTDEKPPIAASGGGGDISVGACESAGCLDDHEGSCLSVFESVTPHEKQELGPLSRGLLSHSKSMRSAGSGDMGPAARMFHNRTYVVVLKGY